MLEAKSLVGLYLAKGTVGNVGMPGAPILFFNFAVNVVTQSVTGSAEIVQAIAGPDSSIAISNLTGTIRSTGYGKVTKVVAVTGEYMHHADPPSNCVTILPFSAHMAIDDSWNGKGGFTYGNTSIEDVSVKPSN